MLFIACHGILCSGKTTLSVVAICFQQHLHGLVKSRESYFREQQ